MVRFRIFLFNLILIALGSILILSNKQTEAGSLNRPTWDNDHMVATRDTSYPSGLLPRGGGVDVTLSPTRLDKSTKNWKANVEEHSTFFCASHGTMLRFGRFDTTLYFLNDVGKNENNVGQGGVVIFGGGDSPSYHGKWTDLLESSIATRFKEAKQAVSDNYPDDNGYYAYDTNLTYDKNTHEMYESIINQLNSQIGGLGDGITYDDLYVYYDYDADIPFSAPYRSNQEDAAANSAQNLEKTKNKIFSKLDPSCQSVVWGGGDITDGGMITSAPSVVVMEKSPGTPGIRGYGTSGGSTSNNQEAYILTAMAEDSYGTQMRGVYHAVIQGAYWIAKSGNTLGEGGHVVAGSSNLAQKGIAYENFRKTYKSEAAYKNAIKIDTSKSKVAAHRDKNTIKVSRGDGGKESVTFENGYYIVGPISMKYPQVNDISYLKTMTLTTYNEKNEKTVLRYGYNKSEKIAPNQREFYLDMDSTIAAANQNGLATKFPKPDKSFYIIFGAKESKYPIRIELEVQAEYLDNISVSLTLNRADAVKYTYEGRVLHMTANESSTFTMKRADKWYDIYQVNRDADGNETGETKIATQHGDSCGADQRAYLIYLTPYYGYNYPVFTFNLRARVYYVGMKASPEFRKPGQPLDTVASATRTYRTTNVKADLSTPPTPPTTPPTTTPPVTPTTPETPRTPNTPPPYTPPDNPPDGPPNNPPPTPSIPKTEWGNLTINLGGHVWYDAKSGKAVVTDGLNNYNTTDKPIPNMKVYLYKYKKPGTQNESSRKNPETEGDCFAMTKTDKKGAYKFEGLNAMYQYYVEFEYNGMYYEPVEEAKGTSSFNIVYDQKGLSQDVLDKNETLHKNWQSNSKAIDFKKAGSNKKNTSISREELNDLFGTISETNGPDKNYSNGFVFTRLWLESNGYIDEYGLSTNASSGAEARFIYDCTIRSFTNRIQKSDTEYAALPEEKAFITDANGNVTDTAIKAEAKKIADENFTKLNDKYLFINFGIKDRGTVDLALWEDISEVKMEINGETREFKYSKRSQIIDEQSSHVTGDGGENDLDKGGYSSTFFDVITRQGAGYYGKDNNSEISFYKSDYNYKLSMYEGTVSKDALSELRVYITYEIKVKNQSSLFETSVDEVINYYNSKALKYMPEESHMEGGGPIESKDEPKYTVSGLNTGDVNSSANCTSMIITNFGRLAPGETKKAYLRFEVGKTTDGRTDSPTVEDATGGGWIVLGDKMNLSEIGKYTTYYSGGAEVPNVGGVGGKVAGIVDRDSIPGNCYSCDNKNQDVPYLPEEDDTDMAPLLKLKLYENEDRVITGRAFEDLRTQISAGAAIGDGQYNGGDPNVNGVTVQFIEIFPDETEYIWREFGDEDSRNWVRKYGEGIPCPIGKSQTMGKGTGTGSKGNCTIVATNHNDIYYDDESQGAIAEVSTRGIESGSGMYGFNGFTVGKYAIRFKYGETTRTVLVSSSSEDEEAKKVSQRYGIFGMNGKSYNGHDYKSTTYGGDYSNNSTGSYEFVHSGSCAKDLKTLTAYQRANYSNSDTRQRIGTRPDVIAYSDENVTNPLSRILSSPRLSQNYTDNKILQSSVDELMNKTGMTADTGVMTVNFENENSGGEGNFEMENVNFGLQERPKSQIDLSKDIQNVRVTLADNTVIFDAAQQVNNIIWIQNKDEKENYKPDSSAKPNTEGLINPELNKAEASNATVEYIKNNTLSYLRENINNHKGFIQLTMDEELMHGAMLKVTYKIEVKNIGEVDYKDDQFYYTGVESNPRENIVTTRIDKIIDYIPNNMKFNKDELENDGIWRVIESYKQGNNEPKLTKIYNYGQDTIQLVDGTLLTSDGTKNISDVINQYNTVIELISKSDYNEEGKTGEPPSRITKRDLVPARYKNEIDNNSKDSEYDFLVLSQTISPENNKDDLTYRNIAEIVRYDNQVGRRMEWSITGNQNPEDDPQELDTDRAETITILPPFGSLSRHTDLIVAITIIVSCVILASGIIFIKRKITK